MESLLESLDIEDASQLQEPLISPPLEDIDYISDIYFPPESGMERWRTFMDCESWDPKQYHDQLLQRRAYHARMFWEHVLLISFTASNWLCLPTLQLVKNAAALSLRATEFEIASYQLTCGMIAFKLEHEKLYDSAIGCFTTMIWMANILLQRGDKTKDRRKQVSDLRGTRPFSVDSKRQLAEKLDGYIFAIKEILKQGGETLMTDNGTGENLECLRQLKQCLILLDGVLVILP